MITESLCYIIEAGPFIKIGYSSSPRHRLTQFQTGCPFELKLLHCFKGGEKTERRLHEAFADYHYRGEWFRYEGQVRKFVLYHSSPEQYHNELLPAPGDAISSWKDVEHNQREWETQRERQALQLYEPFKETATIFEKPLLN